MITMFILWYWYLILARCRSSIDWLLFKTLNAQITMKKTQETKKNWFINNSSDFPRHFYWVDAFLAEHCNDYHCTQHFIYRSWMLHLNCHCLCRLNNDLTNYWIKSSFFLLQIVSTWYNECHCIALVVD